MVYDRSEQAVNDLVKERAVGATSYTDLVKKMQKSRAVWLMVPAAVVDKAIAELVPLLEAGDILIDGGNSYYVDDIRRAKELAAKGIHYVDVGTSGGVWGLDRGYCMMIGGEPEVVKRLDPIFATLAPGIGDIPLTPKRPKKKGTAENGYLHCGPNGAGHFVKMVHNGIEYGLMAAYAEGFGILRDANIGKQQHEVDAETTPLRYPEMYQYDNLLVCLDDRDGAIHVRRSVPPRVRLAGYGDLGSDVVPRPCADSKSSCFTSVRRAGSFMSRRVFIQRQNLSQTSRGKMKDRESGKRCRSPSSKASSAGFIRSCLSC